MATQSILREINITKKKQADKFIEALTQSEALKLKKEIVENLQSNTLVPKEDIIKIFGNLFLDYKMVVTIHDFGDIQEYIARYPALDVIGVGYTREEAIIDLDANAIALLEFLFEQGLEIPKEDNDS